MRVRGLTLIETLLALAMLVMVLSLVGPALVQRIAPMTFERTAGQIESALRLAREDARRTGTPRYVYVEPIEAGRRSRLIALRSPRRDLQDSLDGSGGSVEDFGVSVPEETRDVLLVLPSWIGLEHERPGALGEPLGDGEGVTPDVGRLIVVCIPDGTVLLPRPAWLVDDEGRMAELRVRSAVGQIALGPIERVVGGVADEVFVPEGSRGRVGEASGVGGVGP